MSRAAALALLWLLAAAPPAWAETHSVSYSLWNITGADVLLRFTMPVGEARHLVSPGWPSPTTATVAKYLRGRVSVQADGGSCPAIDQGYDIGRVNTLSVGNDLYSFEIMFRCAEPSGIVLQNSALFELVPQHIDFARVQVNGGGFVARLFTSQRQTLRLPAREAPQAAGFGSYLRIGFLHILRSFDRICFLVGLLVLVRRRRELGYVAAGLSLGYSASIVFCLTGLIVLRTTAAEAWIGFMVALLAAQIIALEMRRAREVAAVAGGLLLLIAAAMLAHDRQAALLLLGAGIFAAGFLQSAKEISVLPTFALLPIVYGFLDGFVLPADFASLGLWQRMPMTGVVAYNAGALLADVFAMALCIAAAVPLRGRKISVPGPAMKDLVATALAGLGTFWLLSRLYA